MMQIVEKEFITGCAPLPSAGGTVPDAPRHGAAGSSGFPGDLHGAEKGSRGRAQRVLYAAQLFLMDE